MELKNPLLTSVEEPFIAGVGSLSIMHNHLCKIQNGAILFCRSGKANFTIDLKQYEIIPNTSIILIPNNIFGINDVSEDFSVSFFCFSDEMFREATYRFEPSFFHFYKENPCYTFREESTQAINGLLNASAAIYADKENQFRRLIAHNHLQCFLLDMYDKTRHWFPLMQDARSNRQEELFKKFMLLVHAHCTTQRDVSFYAGKLCISTKYLTIICTNIIGEPAKKVIDKFILLEIKVLLQSTELTVQEIADRLNFPDQSYLGRYFKRQEGMSPMDYRNKYTG